MALIMQAGGLATAKPTKERAAERAIVNCIVADEFAELMIAKWVRKKTEERRILEKFCKIKIIVRENRRGLDRWCRLRQKRVEM